ncbi:MAG: BatD family protein, partial [Bacteroidota bacterium]
EGVVSSGAEVIPVMALPVMKNGGVFSGAVGKFSMIVKPEKIVFGANENNRIVIELSGTGNLSDVSLPIVHWPDSFDIFDGSQKILDSLDDDFHTTKVFTMTLVAKQPGKYTIDPICIMAFNPEKKSYEKICSQSIELTVQKGSEIVKGAVVKPGSPTNKSGAGRYLVAAIMVALGIGFALLAWKKKKDAIATQKKEVLEAAVKKPPAIVPDYVAMAKASLGSERDADFMHSFKYMMKQYMADRTKMETGEPYEVLLDRFAAMDSAKADAIKTLTAESDYLLYSPGGITAGLRNTLVNRFLETLNI